MRTIAALTLAGALLGSTPSTAVAEDTAPTTASLQASVQTTLATPHLCAGSHSTKWHYASETYWGSERVACAKCMEMGRYKVAHRVIRDFTCIRYTGHTVLLVQLNR